MKKQIIFVFLLFSSMVSFAQVTKEEFDREIKHLNEKINLLQSDKSKLKSEISTLNSKLSTSDHSIENLKSQIQEDNQAFTITTNELVLKIKETRDKSEGKITQVSESLSNKSLVGIIGVLLAILISSLLYRLSSNRQRIDKSELIDQLSKTKSSIEESLISELGKQTELMVAQVHLIEQQNITSPSTPNVEPDHSLALKVASEINLIERNINLMDPKTKGLKQLQASVGKLKDNLSANGYEMPELLGKQFNQGMRVIVATSIPEENLEKGQEIITKVLIPQVNYNDKMIQTAQIEVSVGY